MDFETGRTAALGFMVSGMVLFLTIYLRLKFYRHFVGVALAVFGINFALVSGLGWFYRLFPTFPFQAEVKFYAFTAMAVATWWLLGSLIRQRQADLLNPHPYVDPEQPESWYWLEHRPSGYWAALEPPPGCQWLLLMNDLEIEWFEDVTTAAAVLHSMVEKDTAVVSATKRQGSR